MNAPALLASLLSASYCLCCTIQALLLKGMVPPTMDWVFLHQLTVKTTPSPK
ncbi:rCG41359 [Rattus norvegicus]|uniref:RCG41359 n=1 Tax=Rattus norvegicus TaxID=10116 RepID=A6IHX9_RAT|nr:rCG41359 [Rattus norvegicus]